MSFPFKAKVSMPVRTVSEETWVLKECLVYQFISCWISDRGREEICAVLKIKDKNTLICEPVSRIVMD